MITRETKKIAIIGNSCAGKTWLARQLREKLLLPVTHVDAIQFLVGMKIRPHEQSIAELRAAQAQDRWVIDGYGPLDILEERLQAADVIIFIDLPIWQHYFWFFKRQIKSLYAPREELPAGCNELSLEHTKKVLHNIWQVHTKMRPEMLRILSRDNLRHKTSHIRSSTELNKVNS